MDHLSNPREYIRDYGNSASIWAFGKDWNTEKVSDAILDWNRIHPGINIDQNLDIKTALKRVGSELIWHTNDFKKEDHEFFPFVDNLGFYDPNTSTLSNDPKYLRTLGCGEYYDLCDHTGGYELRSDFDF